MATIKDQFNRGRRFLLKRMAGRGMPVPPPRARREQFQRFLQKIQELENPVVCHVGSPASEQLPGNIKLRYGNFDVDSDQHILDLVNRERIDAFYLNRATPRDLVNLANFLGIYGLEIPILLGEQFHCHSLTSYVPVLSDEFAKSSVSLYNFYANNYRITDTLLCQGYVYQGTRLMDVHQFLWKPDETRIFDPLKEVNLEGIGTAMYYMEAFHPQLPTSTLEIRYIGFYEDRASGYMAGTHSIPLSNWYDLGAERRTLARTFTPNIDGTLVRFITQGLSEHAVGPEIQGHTTLGRDLAIKPSEGGSAIEGLINCPDDASPGANLEMDRIQPGVPILGARGFQTLWRQDKCLAVWHDGAAVTSPGGKAVRNLESSNARDSRGAQPPVPPSPLADESQLSSEIPQTLVDLYQQRARYFAEVFPFLGHEYPDLHIVFDSQQWNSDLRNFDLHLYTEDGTLLDTKSLRFNGELQTVNFNRLFADQLAEITRGYWAVTADVRKQETITDLANLVFPSTAMLFAFWSDGDKMYDSVHSVSARNTVAIDLKMKPLSENARSTNRIVSRSIKWAPFAAGENRASFYWLCNLGASAEAVDAVIHLRLFGRQDLEGVASITLPANCSRLLSAEDVLKACNVNSQQGTLLIESRECNLAALWFLQTGEGKGFATDHFTGG